MPDPKLIDRFAITQRGRIIPGGMGGFLNPPGHPEHTLSVETDLRRRPENRGSLSLSAAVDAEWLDAASRSAARHALDAWVPLPLDDPRVQDWVLQVLGYFRNCFRGAGAEPECWYAANLVIVDPSYDHHPGSDAHAGVHLIRTYYPDFTPTAEHFAGAYWGRKPAPV